ncbi:MAG: hypothetical protein DWQ07_05815 [Chloroflexi bacterium]|nr:MAG: hypothetical protein DWQ07_05815 [Chloroflexota bacterium]MBL1196685.1 hypothetical protein [Chloroflexota bacterium]NOH13978.1 OadG family protein [Chloroflexota bacterium]
MDPIGQGLLISALGMGITFATLGVLIFLIRLLRWVFPAETQKPLEIQSSMPDEVEVERRVAVFAALWYWQNEQRRSPTLGRRLEKTRSPWQSSNVDNKNK